MTGNPSSVRDPGHQVCGRLIRLARGTGVTAESSPNSNLSNRRCVNAVCQQGHIASGRSPREAGVSIASAVDLLFSPDTAVAGRQHGGLTGSLRRGLPPRSSPGGRIHHVLIHRPPSRRKWHSEATPRLRLQGRRRHVVVGSPPDHRRPDLLLPVRPRAGHRPGAGQPRLLRQGHRHLQEPVGQPARGRAGRRGAVPLAQRHPDHAGRLLG